MPAGTEISFFFPDTRQFIVKSHSVGGEGWDGQDQGPCRGDSAGHQAFLHAGLAQTPSWLKPPQGSAMTAKQEGGVGRWGARTAEPLGQQGFHVNGQKAAAVPAHRTTRNFWKFQATS